MDLRETYDLIAEDWHKDHQSDNWWLEGTDAFTSLLAPGATVLDAGCGSGTKTKYLIEMGFDAVGMDFSEALIDIARRETPRGTFVVMDLYDIGNLDRSFDGILAQASLLHIPKKDFGHILVLLVSKLKTRGLLYVAVKDMRPDKPEEEIREENEYGYPYRRFFSYYSMDELEKCFEQLGLEIIYRDSKTIGKTDWLQIIGRKDSKRT